MTPFYLQSAAILILQEKVSAQKISQKISKPFVFKWLKTNNSTLTFLDSFDGRLYNAGFTLSIINNVIRITTEKRKDKSYTLSWPQNSLPKQPDDFKEKPLKTLLNKLLTVRNLSKILTLKISVKPFALLNADIKTIARGHLLTCKSTYPAPTDDKTILIIKSLRGYSADVKELIKTFPTNSAYSSFVKAVFTEYKIDLKDYSKPVYDLKDKKYISQALYEILYKNFLILQKNEKGIIEDIDIEFLHDYRVACRRMRSALSLIKKVLDPGILQMLKLDLRKLGKYSGPLRDLDVYLLREQEYKALLPEEWPQKDIHAIFVKLKSQRTRAYQKMKTMLKSQEYRDLIERWENFFEDYQNHIGLDTALLKTASTLIMKWFRRIIKGGRELTSKEPDEKFHDLRISCKKLRYLLEFFGSLYPVRLIDKAVRQLKKLQENLGDFNDYSVQIETLNQLLRRSAAKNTNFIKTVAGLITVLDYKMQRLKDEFYALFKAFSSERNIKLYKKIFG